VFAILVWAAVTSALATALCVLGYLSVSGEFDAVIRAVRRIVGTVAATASRYSASSATVAISLKPPGDPEHLRRDWLVVVDAADTKVTPKSQVLTPSRVEPSQLTVTLDDPGPDAIDVAIAVYDKATLTPLAQFDTVVPAAPKPGLLRRLAAFLRRASRIWR
jgi:hypothetical protein